MPPTTTLQNGQILVAPHDFGQNQYLRHLNRWKYAQAEHRKEIGVLGAGMSGLVAGWLLKRAGHNVKIFEASNVVGGRVKTLRERFTSGLYAEAGAMRVPETHALTRWLIDNLVDVELWDFPGSDPNTIIYVNNHHVKKSDLKDENNNLGFKLELHEKVRLAEDMFKDCIENFVRRDLKIKNFKIGWLSDNRTAKACRRNHKILIKMDRYSLREFLLEHSFLKVRKGAKEIRKRLSSGAADMISAVLCYETHLSTSMAAILSDYAELHGDVSLYQIPLGMDYLPKSFVGVRHPNKARRRKRSAKKTKRLARGLRPNLADNIQYNARVTELFYEPPKIVVRYENPVTRQQGMDRFDLIVVAIPFSALRHVRMRGLNSVEKRRALRQLHYDNSCKIILEFEHQFWMDKLPFEEPIRGGISISDLALRQTCYPNPVQNKNAMNKKGRGILLASYTWGDDSLRWTSLKPDDRIRFALRDLERLHNRPDGRLEHSCIGGMSHSWAHDEFTSGAFAMFEPYQLRELFKDVWKPSGRLHYCGEHTSMKHGWIEGAVESGIRVAREICERIKYDPLLTKNIPEID